MTRRSAVEQRNLGNYDSRWSIDHYQSETGLRPIEAELVGRYCPPPPARVLDIGCGAGRASIGFAKLGYRVTAVDLSWPMLQTAKNRFPDLALVRMDAAELGCASGQYDVVAFTYNGIDVLYPLQQRLACMREAHRVLRPGGVFVLSTHNAFGILWSAGPLYLPSYKAFAGKLLEHWRESRCRDWYWPYRDGGGRQRLFSAPPAETARQLESVGFKVTRITGNDQRNAPWQLLLQHQHVHFVALKA
jgi:SAM-dependent methyltransferase